MFNDIVTVFNNHKGCWYAHMIRGVDYGSTASAGSTKLNGITKSDRVIVLIRSDADKHISSDVTLQYVPPKVYERLENVEGHITFKPQDSFILIGEYNGAEPISDDDYEAGFFDYMNSMYDNVFMISSAAYFGLIPHFEIEAG